MNQNGCITITGNTRAKARALRDAVNVGVAAFEELDEEDACDGAPERGYAIGSSRSARMERAAPVRTAVGGGEGAKPKSPGSARSTPVASKTRSLDAGPISDAQTEAIRSLCRRGDLDADTLAREKFEAESLSNLTQIQASELIKSLQERANGRAAAPAAA
jgi:hypothetical protein